MKRPVYRIGAYSLTQATENKIVMLHSDARCLFTQRIADQRVVSAGQGPSARVGGHSQPITVIGDNITSFPGIVVSGSEWMRTRSS